MKAMAQVTDQRVPEGAVDEHGEGSVCQSFREAAELLGKRWNVMIVHALRDGGRRFTDLSGSISSISDHVLSQRLKELEAAGIVARTVTPSTPVCISYSLTQQGAELAVVMSNLGDWAEKWATRIP
jgi:DNA-binding HxlR family transcriptional regulator